MKFIVLLKKIIPNIIQFNKKLENFFDINEISFKSFNLIYLLSLLCIILFSLRHDLLALVIILILFNFDFFLSNHQLNKNFEINEEDDCESLQLLINHLWKNKLLTLFQDQLNKIYSIKRKEKKTFLLHGIQFYNFDLDENQPPVIKKILKFNSTQRKDEIILNLNLNIFGNIFLKLIDEQKNKNFSSLGDIDLLNFNKTNNLKLNERKNNLNVENINKKYFIDFLITKFNYEKLNEDQLSEDINFKKKNFLIKNISLSCESKITFKPLVKIFPYFTSLSFSILNNPSLFDNETKTDIFDKLNQFEEFLNKSLLTKICSSFLYPNELYIVFGEKFFINKIHNYLIRKNFKNVDHSLNLLIKNLIKDKKILKDKNFSKKIKFYNWYHNNIEKDLLFMKMNLKLQTYHPFPVCFLKLNIFELSNIKCNLNYFKLKDKSLNNFLVIKTSIGKNFKFNFSVLNNSCPIINQKILLPIHDYYEKCEIQCFIINANLKEIENCLILFKNNSLEKSKFSFLGKAIIPLDRKRFEIKISKPKLFSDEDFQDSLNKNEKKLAENNSQDCKSIKGLKKENTKRLNINSNKNTLKKLKNKNTQVISKKSPENFLSEDEKCDKNSNRLFNKNFERPLSKVSSSLLDKDKKNLLSNNQKNFSNKNSKLFLNNELDINLNLNCQDFWFPLNSNQIFIHLNFTIIKLKKTIKFLESSLDNIKNKNLSEKNLKQLGLPLAFLKIYVDSFNCNYSKDNKIKVRKNQLDQLEIKVFKQIKVIETNKKVKNKNFYEKSVYFFIFENPFNDYLIIELKVKNKNDTLTKDVINKEVDEKNFKFISFMKLKDLKSDLEVEKDFIIREKNMIYFKILPVYIINLKEYEKFFDLKKLSKDSKFIDYEEYGKLTLSLTFGFAEINESLISKHYITPNLKGCYNELTEKKKKLKNFNLNLCGSYDNFKKLHSLNDKSLSEKTLSNIIKVEKSLKNINEDCIGILKFKLINTNCLEIKILKVINIPYDKTKKVNLRVIIELWKGNNKITTKKTPYTNIVVNPIFGHIFKFDINLGNFIQYALRFILIQSSGLFNLTQKTIANKFCTLPLLTLEFNQFTKSYVLKVDEKRK